MNAWDDLIRESSRDSAGRFGPRDHSTPEVTIDAEPYAERTWAEWEELAEQENQRLATQDALHGAGFESPRVSAETLRAREMKRVLQERRDRAAGE